MNKPRFNQLGSTVVLSTVLALGTVSCTGPDTAKTPKATVSTPAEQSTSTPDANITEQANLNPRKHSALERMRITSLEAANLILRGLARPDVNASAYNAPTDLLTVGNADHSGGTNKPETYMGYDPKTHEVYLASLSETDVNKAGASTLMADLRFELANNNSLSKITNRALNVADFQTALSDPANVSLVSAGSTYSSHEGFAVTVTDARLSIAKGYDAQQGELSGSQHVSLIPAQLTEASIGQLDAASKKLESTLHETASQLGTEFTK